MNKTKILLVDNRKGQSETVQEFLELRGYEVFVADNAQAAKDLVKKANPALAVLDIRLIDETDDNDFSGLTLAKQLPAQLHKIMLTAYPTYQAVREALGPALNDVPPAVGFVAKQEGLAKLLSTIQLVLAQLPPTLESNLLQEFQAPALWALRERIEALGARTAIGRLQAAVTKTSEDIAALRKAALQQAEHQQQLSLRARLAGILLLTGTVVLLLLGKTEAGLASTSISLLSEFLRTHFSRLEKQAYKRADWLHEELREAGQDQHLMLLVESLETQSDRDEYRKKVMDHILLRRSD